MLFTPAQIKPKSFELRQMFFLFFTQGGCISCLRACLDARLLLQSYQYPNLWEGTDHISGQLRGDKECPFSGVTKSGRVWRKVLESDVQSVISYLCVWLPKLTSTKEGTIIPMGGRGGCTRRCFDFKRLIIHINYSLILAYHLITKTCLFSINSPTNMMPILTSFICDMTLPFLSFFKY